MNEKENKRIGIFEYDWSMYTFIKDFVIKLAEAGYFVDIFFKDWQIGVDCTDTNDFNLFENIRFFNFTIPETRYHVFKRRFTRLLNKIAIFFSVPRNARPDQIIDGDILNKSKEIIKASEYDCLIGIEKKGLVWAGILSEIYHYPLIYHNLELYTEDNPAVDRYYHLWDAERKYHKLAAATIIQDKQRADVLLKSNGVTSTNLLYYPVCVKGSILQKRTRYLQSKLNISDNKKILLYFGNLNESRCITQIVKMARNLDNDFVLVMHGWGSKKYLDHLQSIADKEKVIFSLDFLDEDEITDMVLSSHIGLALYDTQNYNDRLVAFSSSKIAYYAQCGIPMIAYDTVSFRALVDTYRCAELIATADEIPQKVKKIFENYNLYRQQSYCAYQEFYELDKKFSQLMSGLELTISSEQPVL